MSIGGPLCAAMDHLMNIPGYGKKVERIVRDGLTRSSWPKFLHPYPLSEKHFLVAAQLRPGSLWGVYLVDTFDNEWEDYAAYYR